MSNPFSILEEQASPNKPSKKPLKKKAEKKKPATKKGTQVTKSVEKKKPVAKPLQAPKRAPKVLIQPKETPVENKEEGEKNPLENRNFDGPSALKDYKRDNSKGYFNRTPGQPTKKGGKRLAQRDRKSRTGKSGNFRKDGLGGKYSVYGPQRYVKKRPQEMTDEEWDKQMQVDQQNQKNDEKVKTKKVKKVVEKKVEKVAPVVEEKPEEKKTEKKGDKKGKKRDDKKGKKKGKKFDKESEKETEKVEEEEQPDENEGKTTYEEFMKNRKKPVSINNSSSRKAGEGVKVHSKQLEYVRPLKRDDEGFMKITKKSKKVADVKKEGEKTDSKKTDSKVKSKKKKAKVMSTADFFKGTTAPKKKYNNRRPPKGVKQGKKGQNLDLQDTKNFPTLK